MWLVTVGGCDDEKAWIIEISQCKVFDIILIFEPSEYITWFKNKDP